MTGNDFEILHIYRVNINFHHPDLNAQRGGIMKKLVGFVALLIAIGMLIMMITHNRLIGLIIIALLLLVGYNCICNG